VYRAAPATPADPDRGSALARLTDREREVLTLIGEGRTNAEIARELFVGEGTVKTHINHAFSKLDLRDRAAAVIFAYENDLVGDGPSA
jgi:DNA-binding NarL/FixJ family response regulator